MNHSDVDLMVIGEASLRDLVEPLRSAEAHVSRPVNAVTMRPYEFADRLKEGQPFLLNVLRDPKVHLIGGKDELARMGARRASCGESDELTRTATAFTEQVDQRLHEHHPELAPQ